MILIRWIMSTLAVLATAYLVPGVHITNLGAAVIAALVIGLVNAMIRPLVLLLTLPVNILTLGLFTLIVNALMFWIASKIVPGFDVSGFSAAFFGALVFWLVSWGANVVFGGDQK
ncbi:phage holin family protein [Patescibacteria group bacterium]|nr:phage holin family protein [Patescibacteria group bacterium]